MLSLSRRAAPTRLARPIACPIHNSSYTSTKNAPTLPPSKRPDLGLEQRRAARLAREAKLAQEKQKPSAKQAQSKDNQHASSAPGTNETKHLRPRKPSRRDQVGVSGPTRGTERSRTESTQSGPAEAIMAFSQREAAKRATEMREVGIPVANDAEQAMDSGLPQFVGPEPIVNDIAALLDTVPNLISSVPPLPLSKKMQETPANWIKRVYGGEYSQWQLDSQSYLKGTRGPRSTYAKIILERNLTIPWESKMQIAEVIQKMTKEV